METKQFHISDVISISSSRLVSTRGIDGIYDILNHMTQDDLFTHQLPRARDECAPYILRALPALNSLDTEQLEYQLQDVTSYEDRMAICAAWVKAEQVRLGLPEYVDIESIPHDDHDTKDPIEELQAMAGEKPIIVINEEDLT